MRHLLPPSRTRRIAKWTGLVVCVVIAASWAVSTLWVVGRLRCAMERAQCGNSRISVSWHDDSPEMSFWFGPADLSDYWHDCSQESAEWFAEPTNQFILGFTELPRTGAPARDVRAISMPFWLLFALAAIPTAILWHRDRRTVKPGCCQTCGYDLRASKKICPECGTASTGGAA